MQPVKEIKADGKTLQIFLDEMAENPRNWDNMSKFICFHKRYTLGDKHNYNFQNYASWEEMKKAIVKKEGAAIIKPLYMLDHSGITVSTSPFSCPWDSGQIGFVIVTKEEIRKGYDVKRVTKKLIEQAEKNLESEVKVYDQYLRGDVYYYKVTGTEESEFDSCGGFFGSDFEENGLIESAGMEFSEKKQAA